MIFNGRKWSPFRTQGAIVCCLCYLVIAFSVMTFFDMEGGGVGENCPPISRLSAPAAVSSLSTLCLNRLIAEQAASQYGIIRELRDNQRKIEQKLDQLLLQQATMAMTEHPKQMQLAPKPNLITDGVPCQFVFFLGGGKSGSTMLASWLKHSPETEYAVYSAESKFLDGGKEICVGKRKSINYLLQKMEPQPADMDSCPADRPFVLDGCPNLYEPLFYKNLHGMVGDRGKFIVLVRDPVDRLVSHYNDNRPPRMVPDIDAKIMNAKPGLREGLSKVGILLEHAISEFGESRIIIVVNEIMKQHSQAVMDDLCDFLQLPKRQLVEAPPLNALNQRAVYSWPSSAAVAAAQQRFIRDTEKFMNLLGVTVLPWNIVMAKENVTSDVELVKANGSKTKPKLRIAAYQQYIQSLQQAET